MRKLVATCALVASALLLAAMPLTFADPNFFSFPNFSTSGSFSLACSEPVPATVTAGWSYASSDACGRAYSYSESYAETAFGGSYAYSGSESRGGYYAGSESGGYFWVNCIAHGGGESEATAYGPSNSYTWSYTEIPGLGFSSTQAQATVIGLPPCCAPCCDDPSAATWGFAISGSLPP